MTYYIIRGGSWYDFAFFCRSALRSNGSAPDDRYYFVGFRLTKRLKQ